MIASLRTSSAQSRASACNNVRRTPRRSPCLRRAIQRSASGRFTILGRGEGRGRPHSKASTSNAPSSPATRALKRRISNAIHTRLRDDAAREAAPTSMGPGGQPGNDTETCAAGSHPKHQLFGQATPEPDTTLRPTSNRARSPKPDTHPQPEKAADKQEDSIGAGGTDGAVGALLASPASTTGLRGPGGSLV